MVAERVESELLAFVDEVGSNTSPSPVRAWSPREERARCSVPCNRGPNTILLASMSAEDMGASMAVEGATTTAVFETYV